MIPSAAIRGGKSESLKGTSNNDDFVVGSSAAVA
jgi:hypothetical protein